MQLFRDSRENATQLSCLQKKRWYRHFQRVVSMLGIKLRRRNVKHVGQSMVVFLFWSCIAAPGGNAEPAEYAGDRPYVYSENSPSAARISIGPDSASPGKPLPGIDPQDLSAATRNKLSRSPEGLQVRTLPDGTQLLDLQGRFQNMSAVKLGDSDFRRFNCNNSVDALANALEHGAGLSDVPSATQR